MFCKDIIAHIAVVSNYSKRFTNMSNMILMLMFVEIVLKVLELKIEGRLKIRAKYHV